MILLAGATGSVGYELAKRLSLYAIPAKAIARNDAAVAKLGALDNITPVFADLDDPQTLEFAMEGVDRAFLLTNSTENAEAQQLAFVAAAQRAGVRHIVKLSQLHAEPTSPVRFLRYHAVVEQAIRDSGMHFTFLRPNLFMQGLMSFRQTIVNDGVFYAPIGAAKISLVDLRDIATVAFHALTETGHAGRIYDITGPEALSHSALAAQIGVAIGRPVRFVEIPANAMRQGALDVGFPAWQADGLIEDYAHYARHEAEAVSPDVATVTGHPATSFARFLTDHKDQFLPGTGDQK
jgi:uncharacterized protein YbjT (DUF2867 family)